MPRVLTVTEGNTRSTVMAREIEIRRSPQAVACRKRYVRNLGSPIGPWRLEAYSDRRADHNRDRENPPNASEVSYQA